MNQFLAAIHKGDTYTENGAVTNSTTGSTLADQFGKAGAFRGRSISEVFADQARLNADNPNYALRFVFYLRMITRKIKFPDGSTTEEVQKGQGARDESFKRFLWYALNKPSTFYDNIPLFVLTGAYKDIFDILYLAQENSIDIDINRVFSSVIWDDSDLLRKYIPLQKSTKKLNTTRAKHRNVLAKQIAKFLGMSNEELRKFKSSGSAHEWQQLITKRLYGQINFSKISGKALNKLVNSKFLANHNLTKTYHDWALKQPTIKFTGYVHELGDQVKSNNTLVVKMTIDKQFESLLALNKGALGNRKVITAIDRSGSMRATVAGTTAMNIAESLGIYFSSLMEGAFKDWVIKFSRRSEWVKLSGTFSEKKLSMSWGDCPSNTDFQSVIDSIVDMRKKKPSIPESDFPDTVLVVSDMQFDSVGPNTNYERAKQKLSQVFSKKYVDNFIFIWWDVISRVHKDFPQTIDLPGGYVFSGFDGAVVSFLLGGDIINKETSKQLTMDELIKKALSQEIFDYLA